MRNMPVTSKKRHHNLGNKRSKPEVIPKITGRLINIREQTSHKVSAQCGDQCGNRHLRHVFCINENKSQSCECGKIMSFSGHVFKNNTKIVPIVVIYANSD